MGISDDFSRFWIRHVELMKWNLFNAKYSPGGRLWQGIDTRDIGLAGASHFGASAPLWFL